MLVRKFRSKRQKAFLGSGRGMWGLGWDSLGPVGARSGWSRCRSRFEVTSGSWRTEGSNRRTDTFGECCIHGCKHSILEYPPPSSRPPQTCSVQAFAPFTVPTHLNLLCVHCWRNYRDVSIQTSLKIPFVLSKCSCCALTCPWYSLWMCWVSL